MSQRQAPRLKARQAAVETPSRLRAVAPLLLTLLLALALRLLLWSAPLHLPANDEIEYIAVARDLLAGRGWQFYEHYHWLRAPLYPLWLAGSLWLAGGDPGAPATLHRAALPNIALSVATVYLSYLLARELAGRRAARLAALIGAVLWTFATFASLYMAETLFTFCFTGALLCLVRAARRAEPSLGLIALGGALFGLATLTRSITLLFLPFVALWLLAQAPGSTSREPPHRTGARLSLPGSRLYPALIFVLAAALTIAPWTIRNYIAYGRAIPVETGLSYNLWAFNEPREDDDAIFRTLESIRNPAERSDYASAKGLARLREDPAILLRKLWPNWVAIWRVKPIEDRFLQENYYSDVPLPLFGAALLFDDALYLVVALAGLAGLALLRGREPQSAPGSGAGGRAEDTRPTRSKPAAARRLLGALRTPRALLICWLLYAVGTMLLTHGEARYRHFLFPVLIPYAAWALVRTRRSAALAGKQRPGARYAVRITRFLLLAALVGGTWLLYYPWGWAAQNLARGWYAQRAELAWALGDQAGALRLDERALDVRETLDGWLRLGDHARAAGDTQRALAAYRAARAIGADYIPTAAKTGDLLRAEGQPDAARAAFGKDSVAQQPLTDWSWRELRPPARETIAVGDGLDFGYVGGVYPAELLGGSATRWTNGEGQLRFGAAPLAAPTTLLLRLRLAAPRPDGGAVAAQVCAAGQCQALVLGAGWRAYSLAFTLPAGAPLEFTIRSGTFAAPDGRRLGVMLGTAAIISIVQ